MQPNPRRPYYNYSATCDSSTEQVSTIENKRFWNLWKQLKQRTQRDNDKQEQNAQNA